MTLNHMPGTLSANKYAGSATQAYGAGKIATGTIAAARTPRLTIGTAPARGLNTLVAPPSVPRHVIVSLDMTPSGGGESTADLTQQGLGTIARVERAILGPTNTDVVQGWVLPGKGSYQVRTFGNVPLVNTWSEFNCR